MTDPFPDIQKIIDGFIPAKYTQTRNFENGSCTALSAFVSRGIISTSWIFNAIQARGHALKDCLGILQQLTWRDYFQRLLQNNPDLHLKAMYAEPKGFSRAGLPAALINGKTQITAIDRAIHNLYQQGHIHNHLRLYIASCMCNIAKSKWQDGARWMYYYLKDADVASNFASWQWVSGASREKKYFANQTNINMFCFTQDHKTFLDFPIEQFPLQHIPKNLDSLCFPEYPLHMPQFRPLQLRVDVPICIYTPYNLDPQWRQEQAYNRILFFDYELLQRFPMSLQSLEFIISQALKINAMQFFYGTAAQLQQYISNFIYYQKEHPIFNITGARTDSRDWLFPEVAEVKGSFFKYWNTALRKYKL